MLPGGLRGASLAGTAGGRGVGGVGRVGALLSLLRDRHPGQLSSLRLSSVRLLEITA